jgi:NAD(P)-dependent dehydrogenase (short-subunit alcohol dehydrogenase family)
MDNRLKDRIAIITGGSSGIGAATALRFADSGARVVVADLKSAGIEKQITDKHGKDRAMFVKVDVTQETSIESMVAEAARWGGRVDIICNYAGMVLTCCIFGPSF